MLPSPGSWASMSPSSSSSTRLQSHPGCMRSRLRSFARAPRYPSSVDLLRPRTTLASHRSTASTTGSLRSCCHLVPLPLTQPHSSLSKYLRAWLQSWHLDFGRSVQTSQAPERLLLKCRQPPSRVNSVLAADPVPLQISPSLRPAMSLLARRMVLFVCFFRVRDDLPEEDDKEPEELLLVPLEVDEPLSSELESGRLLFPRRLRSFRRCRFSLFRSFLRRTRALSFSPSAPVTSQCSTIFQTFRAKARGPASPSAACPFSSCSWPPAAASCWGPPTPSGRSP